MHLLGTLFHYVWSFVFITGIIIFIHEYGHFIVARLCGVKVETFSIGFGREILGRTDRHGTRWKLSLIPLGGYVKMFGDASAASNPDHDALQAMSKTERKQSLHCQPLWAKALIVAAGPMANFLLTISIFTYFIYSIGMVSSEPVVGEVMPDTPAMSAGLQPGDRIVKIDDKPIRYFNDIPETLATNLYTPITLTILRGNHTITRSITPIEYANKDIAGNVEKHPLIGISSQKIIYKDVGFFHAVGLATQRTYTLCISNLRGLGQIIMGERSAKSMSGTLGIAKLSGDITNQGKTINETAITMLFFIAVLSAGIGLINLFPLPMLDGGHLLFYAIEALRGRPASERAMEYSYRFGFALIITLMIVTFVNDIKKIFFQHL